MSWACSSCYPPRRSLCLSDFSIVSVNNDNQRIIHGLSRFVRHGRVEQMDYICVFLWWKIVLEHTIQRLKMTTHLLFIAYSVRFLLTGIAAVGMPAPYPTALFTGLL